MQTEIIGAGVVGQALGAALAAHGYTVGYIDTNPDTVLALRQRGLQANCPDDALSTATDVSFLCVPTPTSDGRADYSLMQAAALALGDRLARSSAEYPLVVVKSTVLPGTTQTIIIPALEAASGKQAGKDFGVCVCPEYLREKHAYADALRPPAVVIGVDDVAAGDALEALFKPFDAPIFRLSMRAAELQKYAHNLFNAVKIAFFNEMRGAADADYASELDAVFAATVLSSEGLWNASYGTRDRGPFMGSCLPKDVEAFIAWSQTEVHDATIVRAALQSNLALAKTLNGANQDS